MFVKTPFVLNGRPDAGSKTGDSFLERLLPGAKWLGAKRLECFWGTSSSQVQCARS